MGLDVTAYRGLKRDENPKLDSDGWPEEPSRVLLHTSSIAFAEENWPGRAEGIEAGVHEFADSYGFRAGSYGGYNRWRSDLARLSGFATIEEAWSSTIEFPFRELINFADNEGIIGPVVSAKLAKDFAENEKKAEAFAATFGANGGWWLLKYREWRNAFEMAADNGAVDFH